uniref:Putative secreted protein n=1 Tax=Ixodes scapularis TaxID=6945 RepID=A0A4D5RVL8_IXOSC
MAIVVTLLLICLQPCDASHSSVAPGHAQLCLLDSTTKTKVEVRAPKPYNQATLATAELLRASFPSIVSVSKQMMTRNSRQLPPSMSDGRNRTTDLPVLWFPPSPIDGATFPAFPLSTSSQ